MPQSGILSSIADFLSNNSLVVIGFFIISVAANIIQFVSYVEQKRSGGLQKDAVEEWLRINKGKYTDAQIQDLRREMTLLQDKIAGDIPKEAKRVFLEDQINALSDSIGQSYTRYNQLQQELDANTPAGTLPVSFRRAIEESIMPSYLEKQRKQEFIYWGVVFSVALAILPIVLSIMLSQFDDRVEILGFDYMAGWVWEIGLNIVVLTFLCYRLFRRSTRFQNPKPVAILLMWFFSIVFFGFIFVVTSSWAYLKHPPSGLSILVVLVIATLPIAFSLFLSIKFLQQASRRRSQTV